MPNLSLLLALAAPFALALLMLTLGRRLGPRTGWVALLAPLVSFSAVLSLYTLEPGCRPNLSLDWVPSLGVNLSLQADGLALFFGSVVSGIGILVIAYATSYLDDHYQNHGGFYCSLLFFMGAMQLTVFSSNLLVLFVAWELTGLTSFLLIGFLHENEESRRGARMALLTTGLSGLFLLAGVVLLHGVFGSFELKAMTAVAVAPEQQDKLLAAFLCCFVGIAGKSAQFPLHYWLPNAMAAPTPVSAYLHSATMVKLGVFLTARLLPLFHGLEAWTPVLTTIGFGTMLLGAVLALLSHDLKGVLAYTTVSQLGLLIGHYGLYARGMPVTWDYLHIINHVFYKAGLFMVVGVVDHATGTRDQRALGGLLKVMPLTGVAAIIGAAALAGLPPTTGFLSKELLLKAVLSFASSTAGWLGFWPVFAVAAASVVKVAVAARFVHQVFLGRLPDALRGHLHTPTLGLQGPAALLMAATVLGGILAPQFGHWTHSYAVAGTHAETVDTLHLWHGLTPELLVSLAIVVAGLGFYGILGPQWRDRFATPRVMRFDRAFDRVSDGLPYGARALNRSLGFESPQLSLVATVVVLLGTAGTALCLTRERWIHSKAEWINLPASGEDWVRWGVVGLVAAATIAALRWRHPIHQLFALSIIGLGVAAFFVFYRAPDLALTQMLVETITLLLVLLVILRLRREGADQEELPAPSRLLGLTRAAASVGFGLLLGGGVLFFQQPKTEAWAGRFYLENSVPLAKGTNAVNTVVIDFRGWDTLLEITVLVIAAVGVLGLLARKRTQRARSCYSPSRDLFPVPPDLILRGVALGAFVPLNLLALFLFFRGHNLPGGGFIAGLVTALSLLLLVFVLGVHGLRRKLRFNPITVAVSGVLLALGVTLLPALQGLPLLHHLHLYLGTFYAGTALWFDLGVYLAVVGVALKLILPLMKSVHHLPAFVAEEEGAFMSSLDEPIDVAESAKPKDQKENVS